MRQVLASDSDDPAWSQRTRARMAQIRQENAELPADGIFLQAEGGGYRLWTFAGGRANNLLAKVLESVLGDKVTTSNLYLRLRGQAGASEVAIRQALAGC